MNQKLPPKSKESVESSCPPSCLAYYLRVESGADHGHEVVDALDPGGVGQEVHDEVAQVAAVRRRHDLHRRLQVLTLDRQERVARQGWMEQANIQKRRKGIEILDRA